MRLEKLKGFRFLLTGFVLLVLMLSGCPIPETGRVVEVESEKITSEGARSAVTSSDLPTFYQHSNFMGNAASLFPGSYTRAQMAAKGIKNDDISSLRVPAGFQVELYEHDNFTGKMYAFTSDHPDLFYVKPNNNRINQFSDKLSSVRIWTSGCLLSEIVAINSYTSPHYYVCAPGTRPLIANQTRIRDWEKFKLISLGGGYVAFQSLASAKYVSPSNSGNGPLIADRDEIGFNENFQLVGLGNRQFALKARVNGKYVCAESDGASCLIANRDAIGPWETFEMVMLRTITAEPTLAPEMVNVAGGSMTLQGRSVTLTSFKMGKYEVTYDIWYSVRKWAEANGYYFSDDVNLGSREGSDGVPLAAPTADRFEPVDNVTWFEQIVWCNALSEKEGLTPCYSYNNQYLRDARYQNRWNCGNAVCNWFATGYRIPTEAEWEYAARGGQLTRNYTMYPGADILRLVAWYDNNSWVGTPNNIIQTHPVGLKIKNELGLYDMAGNSTEWCWDWADTSLNYQGQDPATPPGGYVDSRFRSWRGGGWFSSPPSCEMSHRGKTESIVGNSIRLVKRYGD